MKDKNIVWIALLAVAIVFLFSQTQFLGSVVTTCENNEPDNFQEFVAAIDALNGTVNREGNLDLQTPSGLVSYPFYRSASKLGELNVIDIGGSSCSNFLLQASQYTYSRSATSTGEDPALCVSVCLEGWSAIGGECVYNECYLSCSGVPVYDGKEECKLANNIALAEFTLLNNKQVLDAPDGYFWCNQENNLVLYAPTVTVIGSYYAEYEYCTSQETNIISESDCDNVNGLWNGERCLCNSVVMDIGDICQQDITTTVDPTAPLITQTNTTNVTTTGVTKTGEADQTSNQALWVAAMVVAIIFGLYWFFEKGPNKGFFQKKSRRKRK